MIPYLAQNWPWIVSTGIILILWALYVRAIMKRMHRDVQQLSEQWRLKFPSSYRELPQPRMRVHDEFCADDPMLERPTIRVAPGDLIGERRRESRDAIIKPGHDA